MSKTSSHTHKEFNTVLLYSGQICTPFNSTFETQTFGTTFTTYKKYSFIYCT